MSESNEIIQNNPPQEKELLDNLGKIAYTLDKAYLSELATIYDDNGKKTWLFNAEEFPSDSINYASNIRAVKVTRWVFNKEEKPSDCFKNILSLFADGEHSLALVVNRTKEKAEMYFVVKNEIPGGNEKSSDDQKLLLDSILGNFPGTESCSLESGNEEKFFSPDKEKFLDTEVKSISVLANVPSEKSEDFISQGLDKLLNGIVPKDNSGNYVVIFLAESVSQANIHEILSGFEDMATAVSPFV